MGKLTEQPLAELIREISIKGLSGILRLEYERMQTAVYFDNGQLIYAASNLRTLRLREYLAKRGLVSEEDRSQAGQRPARPGTCRGIDQRWNAEAKKDIDALLLILVSDNPPRVSLLWTEGTWGL